MLSKKQLSHVTSLHQKKFRKEKNLFICEGEKIVSDLLQSELTVSEIFCTAEYLEKVGSGSFGTKTEVVIVTEAELKKISTLVTPNHVLAVVEIPSVKKVVITKGLTLVLDNISDPGNMGTLIRIADWFGISQVICSHQSVECYNPKVVQSAMGSLFRISINYADLKELFSKNESREKLPVYGAMLAGKNVYKEDLSDDGYIVMGNESTGISDDLTRFITNPLTIPSFMGSQAESLNVAVAAGIICSEFRR